MVTISLQDYFAPIVITPGQPVQVVSRRDSRPLAAAPVRTAAVHVKPVPEPKLINSAAKPLTINGQLAAIDRLLTCKRHEIAERGPSYFAELAAATVEKIYHHACSAIQAESESKNPEKIIKSRVQAYQIKAWIEEFREDYTRANASLAQALSLAKPIRSSSAKLYAALSNSKKAITLKLDPRVDLRRIRQEAAGNWRQELEKLEEAFFQACNFKDVQRAAVFKLVFLTRAAHLCFENQNYEDAKAYSSFAQENLAGFNKRELPLRLKTRVMRAEQLLTRINQDLDKVSVYQKRLGVYRAQANQEAVSKVLAEAITNPKLNLGDSPEGFALAQDYFQTCVQAPLFAADINAALQAQTLLAKRLNPDLLDAIYRHASQTASQEEQELLTAFRLYSIDPQQNHQEILDATRTGLGKFQGPQTSTSSRSCKEALLWFECKVLQQTTQVGQNILNTIRGEYPDSKLLAEFLTSPYQPRVAA